MRSAGLGICLQGLPFSRHPAASVSFAVGKWGLHQGLVNDVRISVYVDRVTSVLIGRHMAWPVHLKHSFFKKKLIYFNWRLITLQYCSGFCLTLAWISHECTCVPHPESPSHLPPHPISLGKSHFKKSVNFMSKDIATNVTGLPRAKKWDNLKVEMTGWQSSGCILNIQKPIGSWWKI